MFCIQECLKISRDSYVRFQLEDRIVEIEAELRSVSHNAAKIRECLPVMREEGYSEKNVIRARNALWMAEQLEQRWLAEKAMLEHRIEQNQF